VVCDMRISHFSAHRVSRFFIFCESQVVSLARYESESSGEQ
jgi:hypothetical protein